MKKGILWEIEKYLEDVQPKEEYKGYKYKIKDILTITILGLISGMTTMKMIHKWASSEKTKEFLRRELEIPFVPCYSQFTVILGNIDSNRLNFIFMEWAQSIVGDIEGKTIAIDGKTIRSTDNFSKSPLHIVSAYISELGLVLGQMPVDGKQNEIPCAKHLLDLLNVEGSIIVADAMHCQQDTVNKIIEREANYLLCVKGNQQGLLDKLKSFFENPQNEAFIEQYTKTEKNGGRIERRIAFVSNDVHMLELKGKWKKLCSICAICREVEQNGKKTIEWHYYISSLELTAEEFLKHVRLEWKIESMHWLLDVNFREDNCMIREKNTQFVLNILRKIVLNLLKKYKDKNNIKEPMTGIMANCLFDYNTLLDVSGMLIFLFLELELNVS